MVMTATGHEHVVIGNIAVPMIAVTATKVVELVVERLAYGWSPEELQFQHPYLTLGQIYSAPAYYRDHAAALPGMIWCPLGDRPVDTDLEYSALSARR